MTDTGTVADRNEELREIPAETRRGGPGFRAIGVPTERSEDFGGAVRRLFDLLRPERRAQARVGREVEGRE